MTKFFGCEVSDANSARLSIIFESFDSDGSGSVDFKELMRGLSVMMAPSHNDLVDFYFHLYDDDHDGVIDSEELHRMLDGTKETRLSDLGVASAALTDLASSGKAAVSIDEFKDVVASNAELRALISQRVSSLTSVVSARR